MNSIRLYVCRTKKVTGRELPVARVSIGVREIGTVDFGEKAAYAGNFLSRITFHPWPNRPGMVYLPH